MSVKKGAKAVMGRPPLSPEERLSRKFMIRLSEAEYALLEAEAGDRPVSAVAREVLARWLKGRRRR